jgi:hypothetical protein
LWYCAWYVVCCKQEKIVLKGARTQEKSPLPSQSESRMMNKFKATMNKKMTYVNKSLPLIWKSLTQ